MRYFYENLHKYIIELISLFHLELTMLTLRFNNTILLFVFFHLYFN